MTVRTSHTRISKTPNEEERRRIVALLEHERLLWRKGLRVVAGVDEVGRGPLAGPVVAAAVVFPPDILIPGVDDSKRLSATKRECLYLDIFQHATGVGVGVVHHTDIDRLNILSATQHAIRKALGRLPDSPEHVLIDGRGLPEQTAMQTAIVHGDRRCFSIAAASIMAKVIRDRIMLEYDRIFPEYGFGQHKGYGTRQHIDAIRRHGFCPIHRRSFKIRALGETQ